MVRRGRRTHVGRHQSRYRRGSARHSLRQPEGSSSSHCRRPQGDAELDEADRLRPRQGLEENRRAHARASRRHRSNAHARTGQTLGRGQGRGSAFGRHFRMVRRRSQAQLWADHPQLGCRQTPHDVEAPGRCSRRHQPLELPHNFAGAQDRPGVGSGLHDRLQARQSDAVVFGAGFRMSGRCGRSGGRGKLGDRASARHCGRIPRKSSLPQD